jgi:hypothetical protein
LFFIVLGAWSRNCNSRSCLTTKSCFNTSRSTLIFISMLVLNPRLVFKTRHHWPCHPLYIVTFCCVVGASLSSFKLVKKNFAVKRPFKANYMFIQHHPSIQHVCLVWTLSGLALFEGCFPVKRFSYMRTRTGKFKFVSKFLMKSLNG